MRKALVNTCYAVIKIPKRVRWRWGREFRRGLARDMGLLGSKSKRAGGGTKQGRGGAGRAALLQEIVIYMHAYTTL